MPGLATPGLSHLVLAGFEGRRLDPSTRRRLARLEPGGVVLFGRNVGSPEEVERLARAIRDTLGPACLIAIDQEGGRVARLRAPFTEWPPMKLVGAARSPALARAVGRHLGRELAAAGLNCDFAPVLDVATNPRNPVIGDRAFDADPAVAARLGVALAAGLGESGVLACGKHFPGHGDTSLDSHLALPVVARSRAELARVELRPFRAAIRAGIPLLMTAHVLYPALDPERPATLSPEILRALLRDRLRFAGIVVSDDLAMRALDGHGSTGELAIQALEAGCDWILACRSLDDAEDGARALDTAVGSGRLAAGIARAALARVERLRRTLARRPPAREDLRALLRRREGDALLARIAARGAALRDA